jgi:hypothetical protein
VGRRFRDLRQLLLDSGVLLLECGRVLLDGRAFGTDVQPRRALRVKLQAAQSQARLFDLVVETAQVVELELLDGGPVGLRFVHQRRQRGHRRLRPRGRRLLPLRQADRPPDERPVVPPLDVERVGRLRARLDIRFVHPAEVGAGQVTVAQLQLDPEMLQVLRGAGLRNGLAADHLAHQDAAVGQRELLDFQRPEEAEAAREDEHEHARNEQQADAEPAAREPDRRFTASRRVHH